MTAIGGGQSDGRRDDAVLLAAVADMYEAADPMPADLPDRIRFALELRDLEGEVARFVDGANEAALATRGAEESRTVTFDSESLTIMIRVDSNPDGTARVDGWLAPPQAHQVQMRLSGKSIVVTADELGRFVFHSVPRGTARLLVHPPHTNATAETGDDSCGNAKLVITPALSLLASEWPHQNAVLWKLTAARCGRAIQVTPLWRPACFAPASRISAGAGR